MTDVATRAMAATQRREARGAVRDDAGALQRAWREQEVDRYARLGEACVEQGLFRVGAGATSLGPMDAF